MGQDKGFQWVKKAGQVKRDVNRAYVDSQGKKQRGDAKRSLENEKLTKRSLPTLPLFVVGLSQNQPIPEHMRPRALTVAS